MDEMRLAQATEWFGRLREETMPPQAIAAWLQWCEADPENLRAYRGVQEIWTLAGDAGVMDWPHPQSVRADQYDGEAPIAEWHVPQISNSAGKRWHLRAFAAAATVLLALAGSYSAFHWYSNWSTPQYTTSRGAQRALQLSDGSAVTLGGASTVRVVYGKRQREVQLESGEAYFKVARDPARPFVVRTKALQITALGTAFTVRADDERTVVAVTEGKVEIAPLDSSRVVRAQAGQQIDYDMRVAKPVVRPSDAATALGWQGGALTYVDEPLRAVVARLNRYSNRDVRLADSRLGELRFTGTVFETQVDEWASGLERVFPVRAIVQSDGGITLAPRK